MTMDKRWSDRVGHRLKLRDLHILLAVVRSGSMGKAASDLAVSQPAVSKAVSDLEYTLGVRLLDRSPQGVEPTMYGRALLKWGTAIFDDLRQGVSELEFLLDPTAGEVSIGCTEPLAAGIVSAIVDQSSLQFPKVVFHVVTGDPVALHRELSERHIELALMTVTVAGILPEHDVETNFLFDDRHVVLAAAESKWRRRRKIALRDLIDEPWVLPPPGSGVGAYIAEAFRAGGVEPPRAHVVTFSIPLHYSLVATGRFLTMLPVSMLPHTGHLSLRRLAVNFSAPPRAMGIVTLKNRTLSPLAHHFIDCARKVAKAFAQRE
jgi:LysR family pca operon transcriptional activator